jgi:hypothetical protein
MMVSDETWSRRRMRLREAASKAKTENGALFGADRELTTAEERQTKAAGPMSMEVMGF